MTHVYTCFDQFEISRLIPIELPGSLDISITNSTVFLALPALYILFLYQTNIRNGLLVPGRYQLILELFYET
jgi:F0F1-type ATP synthase membrane subunit a